MDPTTPAADWLNRLPIAGWLGQDELARVLKEIGEDELADSLLPTAGSDPAQYGVHTRFQLVRNRAWLHTAHSIGYLAPTQKPQSRLLPIRHAANIQADRTLQGTPLKLTLDGLRVADYPGRGVHSILFDFAAHNQTDDGAEHLHFNTVCRAADGEQTGGLGRPIFTGIQAGAEGLYLQFATVNVLNEADEAFLGFLGSDSFKRGLQLLGTSQPALIPLAAMASGLTETLAKRHRNVAVQAVDLGLDFSSIAPRPRLAEGSYIAVQIPETHRAAWRWQDWGFDPLNGRIVNVNEPDLLIPHNYVIISVSRCDAT